MPVEDILNGVIHHARSMGKDSENILNMVIFDVWDSYKNQSLAEPITRLKYSCDIVSNFYNSLELYQKVMGKGV